MANLGYTSESGASSVGTNSGGLYLTRFGPVPAGGGTATTLTMFTDAPDANWAELKGVVYADSSGAPGNLLASTANFQSGVATPSWVTQNLQSPLALTAGQYYWIGYQVEHDSTHAYLQPSTGNTTYRTYTGTFGSPASPFGSADQTYTNTAVCVYITYTAGATLSAASPTGTIGTQTTATLGATTDQGVAGSNDAYAVWSTSNGFSGVTPAQVKAGQNAAGSTSGVSNSGAVAITSTTISIPITGLSAGTTYYYAITQENANGFSNVVTGSFVTAAATTSVTIGLGTSGSPLASTACKFWTKSTLAGAAVDGGSSGISGTTDASGNITLTGLTITAGAKYLQYQVGTDPLNIHVVPVTYA